MLCSYDERNSMPCSARILQYHKTSRIVFFISTHFLEENQRHIVRRMYIRRTAAINDVYTPHCRTTASGPINEIYTVGSRMLSRARHNVLVNYVYWSYRVTGLLGNGACYSTPRARFSVPLRREILFRRCTVVSLL